MIQYLEHVSTGVLTDWDRVKNDGRVVGVLPALDDAELLLQPLQLLHADVVAAAHHHYHRSQALGRHQLAFYLQPLDDAAVDGGQGGAAGRLHQHLLVVCRRERRWEISWNWWCFNIISRRTRTRLQNAPRLLQLPGLRPPPRRLCARWPVWGSVPTLWWGQAWLRHWRAEGEEVGGF